MEILLYIVIGLVVLKILYEVGNAIENAAREKARERKRQREDEKSAREREAAQRRLRAESEKRKEQERREEQKKEAEKEAEADKLVPRFMRSDLTKAIIKTAKAKTGVGETVAEIVLSGERCFLRIVTGVVNNELRYKQETVTYRELGFQSLNDEIETAALAKAVAKTLGSDYEWHWLCYITYKHMDKLEPKLRSAI